MHKSKMVTTAIALVASIAVITARRGPQCSLSVTVPQTAWPWPDAMWSVSNGITNTWDGNNTHPLVCPGPSGQFFVQYDKSWCPIAGFGPVVEWTFVCSTNAPVVGDLFKGTGEWMDIYNYSLDCSNCVEAITDGGTYKCPSGIGQ